MVVVVEVKGQLSYLFTEGFYNLFIHIISRLHIKQIRHKEAKDFLKITWPELKPESMRKNLVILMKPSPMPRCMVAQLCTLHQPDRGCCPFPTVRPWLVSSGHPGDLERYSLNSAMPLCICSLGNPKSFSSFALPPSVIINSITLVNAFLYCRNKSSPVMLRINMASALKKIVEWMHVCFW